MKKSLLAAAAVLFAFAATAQEPAATLKIWDNRTAPHSNEIVLAPGEDNPDRTDRTTETELYIYPADTAPGHGTGRGDLPPEAVTWGWPSATRGTTWPAGCRRTA